MVCKKVLYVITKSNWGGAQRYVHDLATNLPPEYEAVVAAGSEGLLFAKLKRHHVRTIVVPGLGRDIRLLDDLNALVELYRLFRKERPHVLHLNSSKAGFLGALAGRLAGVRHIVFTVHGWPFNEPVSKLKKFVRWSATLVSMLLVDRAIAVSHFGTLLAPLGIKTVTIHNGIPALELIPREEARRELCEKTGVPYDAFIFGSIAELHANKGLDVLIEATYLVDDVYVIVIGEGEERGSLEKLIADLDLGKRVHLVGFIDNASRYLRAFDAFVLPSRTEALGYVLLEAGMAEVPVIASAVGGIPEIIEDQISGDLFHSLNDLALAESMREFTTSPNTIRHYAEALKAHVQKYFSIEVMVHKTVGLYEL